MGSVRSILAETSWWPINKEFAKTFGLDAAIYIMDLSTKQEYFNNRGDLDKEGYFFNTKENIEFDTTLSPYQQNKALKALEQFEIVKTKRRGIPAKVYYKINIQKLNEVTVHLHNNPIKRKKLKPNSYKKT